MFFFKIISEHNKQLNTDCYIKHFTVRLLAPVNYIFYHIFFVLPCIKMVLFNSHLKGEMQNKNSHFGNPGKLYPMYFYAFWHQQTQSFRNAILLFPWYFIYTALNYSAISNFVFIQCSWERKAVSSVHLLFNFFLVALLISVSSYWPC